MKSDILFLRHILEEIDDIEALVAEGRSTFDSQRKNQKAMIRSLEVIGEAVKHISDEARSLQPQIPWRQIAGMRDRLIHGYFTVNLEGVWNTAVNHLTQLKEAVTYLLEQYKK